jgi:hypothetical protein
MPLLDELWSVPAVDHHAHNVNRPELAPPFVAGFTESFCATVWQRDTPHGLFYRRSLKRLARLLGSDESEQGITAVRQSMTIEQLTALYIKEANLWSLFLDDGLSPEALLPWDWHEQFVPTYRLLRIEHLAQGLFAEHQNFDAFEEAFRTGLRDCGPEVVGFKCIAAYRGGLSLPEASREQARDDYVRARQTRVSASPLYSYLVGIALEVASAKGLPVQFHTGFGDPDLDLALSNPLLLRPLISKYSCPFVLLHAGYPFFREVGFLASVYSNVWTDFGLAVPYLSVAGMRATVSGLLELAPLNKVMYSSDASLIPELFFLGAAHGREVLAEVLTECRNNGDLSLREAEQAGRWILAGNARSLYLGEEH